MSWKNWNGYYLYSTCTTDDLQYFTWNRTVWRLFLAQPNTCSQIISGSSASTLITSPQVYVYFVLGSWPCHKQVWLMCCFLTQALLLYHLLSSFIIKKREWLLSNSTDTEATIIKEKQAPQINTISRWKRYNKNWRKINKSKHPEFSKASINISWQTSCRAVAYSTISQNLSLW